MKIRGLKYWLLFFLAVLNIPASSSVSFFYYGVENGLPETQIISITQDALGFVWLAGENSLFRFDGNQFKSYYKTGYQDTKLFQGKLTGLYTDKRGVLWVGSQFGIFYYNFMLDRFIQVPGLERVQVSGISEDSEGNLWFGSDEGLACMNTENLETIWFTGTDTLKTRGNQILPVSVINHVACQPDGQIWFSSQNTGLYRFDPQKRAVYDYTNIDNTDFRLITVSHLKFFAGKIYISTINDGLLSFNPDKGMLIKQDFGGKGFTIQQFHVTADTLMWLASSNGLIRYSLGSGKYSFFINEIGNQQTLIRTANIFVFSDKDQNLWISNGIKGINFGLNDVPFSHFGVEDNDLVVLKYKEVTSMCFQGDDVFWIGYEGGMIERHNLKEKTSKVFESAALKMGRQIGAVMSIFKDSRNQIWMGGWRTGLQKLSENGRFFEYPYVSNSEKKDDLINADVRGITEDKSGNIWFTMHGHGVGCYNPDSHKMREFSFNSSDSSSRLSNDYTYDICTDDDGNLWISSAYGLTRLEPETGKCTIFLHNDSIQNSLSSNEVNTIINDKSGYLWAGTNNGLNVFNKKTKSFQPVLTDKEIPFLAIKSIISTKPGEIWATTQTGLICLQYSWPDSSENIRFTTRFFDRTNGIASSTFFPRSVSASDAGFIYFSGNEGIDFFDPITVLKQKQPEKKPLITEMSINGAPLTDHNLKVNDGDNTVILRHSDKMFRIGFTILQFNNWRNRKFRFMLEGFNDKWIYAENERVATFASLPPGKYKFILEVQDGNFEWNAMDLPLNIVVKQPFWMTLPFIITVFIMAYLFFYLYQRRRSRILLVRQRELELIIEKRTSELVKKNTELEIANREKNKFFSIVSHDLRSPFSTLISIIELLNDPDSGLDEVKKKELLKSTEVSAKNTFGFLETLLTWARSQMNQISSNPEIIDLSKTIAQNVELKLPTAKSKGIAIRKHLPETLDAVFDVEMINTVLRNILSNALKFTRPGGIIDVSLAQKKDEAEVTIADSGIGMTEEDLIHIFDLGKNSRKGTMGEKGTGLGLIICKEFIEKNKGKLWVTANEPQGTVFHFTLPLSKI